MRNDKQKASPQKSRLARAWRKNCHQLQIDYAGAGGSALGAAGEGQPALGSVKTTRSKQLNVREEAIRLLCPLKYVQKCGDEACACRSAAKIEPYTHTYIQTYIHTNIHT
jgi:hypothetical protein